ncbi:SulP family inorganic anion transporter [Gluconobacter morbifer]|uniref:Sulfate permease n=1 Tax=Gluconobacter morbifer G707 TaxID=1088869 RepID=G6XL69_9PROT|nr:SulP family inorganic anion transporter [Gluconobacter morbifer]EHH67497.1 sulfate permease [Gluconobacter morbifer G707]
MTEPDEPSSPRPWWSNVLAGVSLASINIPQVLGYTRIAAMPAVTGLYTVLMPLIAFAAFGSSRHLVVAADSATAAIFSSALSRIAAPGSAHYSALVSGTALLSAIFLLFARLFRLGFLADFLSRTVLAGFLTGVGFQVSIAMLHDMLDIPSTAQNTLMQLGQTLTHLSSVNITVAGLSVLTVLLILTGRRLSPHLPVGLFVVIGSIVLSRAADLPHRGVPVLGTIAGGLPRFGLPHLSWADFLALMPVAASCVFVIIAQSAATSRAFAERFEETDDENRDLLGLAAANAAAAISGTFTVNGSPTQTAMAVQAGARTQIAQITFACVTFLVLMVLTGPLQALPHCVLGAIVFTVAIGMIDLRGLRAIRQESPGEFWLAVTTAAVVVGVGVEQGIFLAIALSLFRHVRHSYEPHTMVLQRAPGSSVLESVPARPGAETAPGLIVFRFCADLFYANSHRFSDDLLALINGAGSPVRCIVIDASPITDIDYSAAQDLRILIEQLQKRHITILFGRVSVYLRADMDRHHITPVLGSMHIFTELHTALQAAQTCY